MKSYNDLVSELYKHIEQTKQAKSIVIPKCEINQHPSIIQLNAHRIIGQPPNISISHAYKCKKCNHVGAWTEFSTDNSRR